MNMTVFWEIIEEPAGTYGVTVHINDVPPVLIASGLQSHREALEGIVNALTAPLTEAGALDELREHDDELASQTSDLLDRVAALEAQALVAQQSVELAQRAVMNLLANGVGSGTPVGNAAAAPAPLRSPIAPRRMEVTFRQPAQPRQPAGAQPSARDTAGTITEPGLAGTFRRPLAETVHAAPGQFQGGAFGRGGTSPFTGAASGSQPPAAPSFPTDDEEG